jgi:hypothetical protein
MNLTNTEFQKIPWNDIVSFGQKTMLDSDLFSVSWILGRFCNYNCSYCWPYAKSKIVDHQNIEIYKKTIDEIKKQARENKFNSFHFSFSGGEPTAYKDFIKLINYYSEDKTGYQSFHMTSNCSPSLKWWNNFLPVLSKFNRASVTASFHAEFANENEFIDKLLFLIENKVYVIINQVMVPEHFYEYYERCSRFYKAGIPVTLKPQSNTSASSIIDGYTNEMIGLMQVGFPQHVLNEAIYQIELRDSNDNFYNFDQAERFNAFGFNKFKNWKCNSGYQSIIIRGNEVKRGYSCSDTRIGTITDGFKLFNNSSLCVTESCVSSADSKIPKWK